MVEKIVGLAENLIPVALIGPGGIGKTSVALAVLHHDRIKERFGDNRWFLRCDQFPASRTHFISRLSKVIGSGIENPEDLTPLRPFLSSRKIILVLDNAESIIDPQEKNAREIYTTVEELSQFETVCLCITSRISTVPGHCKRPVIPTLSIESACDIFYSIYGNGGRSDIVGDLLKRLDFHALSITLLAATASCNAWDYDRLAQEWDTHRTRVLRADYNESLAATIELSLASPAFRELGSDARDLLDIIAFLPQGVDENKIDWLFPTTSDGRNTFDRFCALSITYRSGGFLTMLPPLRDYLRPKDPMSSPLLRTVRDSYFRRLSVDVYPGKPGYDEAQWITSEDVNIEYLLDVFASIDADSIDVWSACCNFMEHLYWYKPRLVVLGPKIEELSDDHPSKPRCLFQLSWLFDTVGDHAGGKQLLTHALGLWRKRGNDLQAAQTLMYLSKVNRQLRLYDEGIPQAKEASEICERLEDVSGQAQSLLFLAWSLYEDAQLDAAEEAASRAKDLLLDKSEQFRACLCHRLLGNIHRAKHNTGKAINHFEAALGIASPSNWHHQMCWIHYSLAQLSFNEDRPDDAHAHIDRAKSHAIDEPYPLGRAMQLQAGFWYKQRKFEEAKSEALRAADIFERIGATEEAEECRGSLRGVERHEKLSFLQ